MLFSVDIVSQLLFYTAWRFNKDKSIERHSIGAFILISYA